MSIESMHLVLTRSKAKGTNLLILLGIANHDGDGGAWPSIATLAAYGRCSESTVHRTIRALVAMGELRVHLQDGGTRATPERYRPNRYEILIDSAAESVLDAPKKTRKEPDSGVSTVTPHPDSGVSPVHGRGVTCARQGCHLCTNRGVIAMTPEPSLQPSLEPSLEPSPARDAHGSGDHAIIDAEIINDAGTDTDAPGTHDLPGFDPQPATNPPPTGAHGFNEFWALYPRKVGKAAAVKAWAKAVKATSPGAIISGLMPQAAKWDHELRGEVTTIDFVPHASTWLNGRRWEDEPEPIRDNRPQWQRERDTVINGYLRDIAADETNQQTEAAAALADLKGLTG